MASQAVTQLIDKWMKEPRFRTELRRDPEGVVKKTGCQLTEEEWAAFRQIDWKLSDEELEQRVTKAIPVI